MIPYGYSCFVTPRCWLNVRPTEISIEKGTPVVHVDGGNVPDSLQFHINQWNACMKTLRRRMPVNRSPDCARPVHGVLVQSLRSRKIVSETRPGGTFL